MVTRCKICGKGFNTKAKRYEHEELCIFIEGIHGKWFKSTDKDVEDTFGFIGFGEEIFSIAGFNWVNGIRITSSGTTSHISWDIEVLKNKVDAGTIEIYSGKAPKIFTEVVFEERNIVVEKLREPTVKEAKEIIRKNSFWRNLFRKSKK